MRRIVSNTGPVLHLLEAQAFDLLSLTGDIHLPIGVEHEIARVIPAWQRPNWITVDKLSEPYATESATWEQAGLLHAGEAATIGLARQLKAEWVLTDDTAARLVARTLGLEVHGSLGVVLWAAAVGHLARAEAEVALERLSQSSLWLSAKVLAEAKEALEEIFRV